jgi:hypothetical protein
LHDYQSHESLGTWNLEWPCWWEPAAIYPSWPDPDQREEWWVLVPDPPNRDREMLGWNTIFIRMFCILLCIPHFTPTPPKKTDVTISTNNAHSYNTHDPIKDKKFENIFYIYI